MSIKLYSTDDVADILGITRRTLYNYISTNQLKAVKIGKRWKISEDALNEFLATGTTTDYYERLMKKL